MTSRWFKDCAAVAVIAGLLSGCADDVQLPHLEHHTATTLGLHGYSGAMQPIESEIHLRYATIEAVEVRQQVVTDSWARAFGAIAQEHRIRFTVGIESGSGTATWTVSLLEYGGPGGDVKLPVPFMNLTVSTDPRGHILYQSAEFPVHRTAGRRAPQPGDSTYENTVSVLKRVIKTFADGPIRNGSTIYATSFADLIHADYRGMENDPSYVVQKPSLRAVGLTSFQRRPCLVGELSGSITGTGRFGTTQVEIRGYELIDLASGLVVDAFSRLLEHTSDAHGSSKKVDTFQRTDVSLRGSN